MDYKNSQKLVSTLLNDIDKKKLLLDHPVQREPGQFNRYQKNLFIDSVLRNFPIPALYFLKDGTNTYVLDGLQRLTILQNYVADAFKLGPNHEPVQYETTDDKGKLVTLTYDISGKRFSQLPDELQKVIKERELTIITLEDFTDEQVNNVFIRLNNGTPLNTSQKLKAYTNSDFKKQIAKIKSHDLFTKYSVFSPTQRIKGAEDLCVIHTLMLTKGIRNFTKPIVEKFVKHYTYNKRDFDKIEKAVKELGGLIRDDVPAIPRISLPIILNVFMSCDDTNKDLFISQLNDFLDNYENETEYRALCKCGTTNEVNIVKRIAFFEEMK